MSDFPTTIVFVINVLVTEVTSALVISLIVPMLLFLELRKGGIFGSRALLIPASCPSRDSVEKSVFELFLCAHEARVVCVTCVQHHWR